MVAVINPKAIAEGNVEDIKPDLQKFDKAQEQVNLAVAELNKYVTISTEEQRNLALEVLKQAGEVDKAIESKRKELVKPWNDGATAINAYVKKLTINLNPTIQTVKSAVLAFQKAEEQKALAAKKQARKEQVFSLGMAFNEKNNSFEFEDVFLHAANLDVADDNVWNRIMCEVTQKLETQKQAKLEQLIEDKDLIEAFGSDEDKMALEEKLFNATKVAPAAPIVVAPSPSLAPSKLNGAAKAWKFKVTDPALVPREFLVVDETLIRKAVGAGSRSIPGVEIFQEDQLRIR